MIPKQGIIDGKARPTISIETESTALIDGNKGFGLLAYSIR